MDDENIISGTFGSAGGGRSQIDDLIIGGLIPKENHPYTFNIAYYH
jgi:hypothetical protein